MKYYMGLILTTDVQQWFIAGSRAANVATVNERLRTFKLPSRVSRRPRSLKYWKQWKGTEWRNFLLYYAIPCFNEVLKPQFVKHWRLLAEAIFTMNSDSFTEQELQTAELKLTNFVQLYRQYFGNAHLTYNIHLLQHLGTTVRNWGPIWSNSGAIFEAWHRRMVDFTTAPTARGLQIVRRFLLSKFVELAATDPTVFPLARNEIWVLTRVAKWNVPPNISTGQYFLGVTCLGDEAADDQEVAIVNAVEGINIDRNTLLTHYSKAIIHGTEYRTHHNQEGLSLCNYVAYCGNEYYTIDDIVSFEMNGNTIQGVIGIVLDARNLADRRANLIASYMKSIVPTEEKRLILHQDVQTPAFTVQSQNMTLVIRLPNCFETD